MHSRSQAVLVCDWMGRHLYHVLVSGHLIQFELSTTAHHRRFRTINLLDVFITSGHLAAQALPRDEYDAPLTARRYQDGLETEDWEEDLTMVVW